MRLNWQNNILLNDEPGEGGGGGEPAPAPNSGDGGSAIASAAEVPIHESFPEKFRIFDDAAEEGGERAFNLEKSSAKLAESYSALEKKFGTGDIPPESADGYQLDAEAFGEDFDADAFMSEEANKAFFEKAHEHGFTNKQAQFAVEYALKELIPNMAQGSALLDAEGCIKQLQTDVWQQPGEYKENMSAANRAYLSLPDSLQAEINKEIGNSPLFNQVMAHIGKQMGEDSPPSEANQSGGGIDVQAIQSPQAATDESHPMHQMAKAYRDPKNPDHERISKIVSNYYSKQFPGRQAH